MGLREARIAQHQKGEAPLLVATVPRFPRRAGDRTSVFAIGANVFAVGANVFAVGAKKRQSENGLPLESSPGKKGVSIACYSFAFCSPGDTSSAVSPVVGTISPVLIGGAFAAACWASAVSRNAFWISLRLK